MSKKVFLILFFLILASGIFFRFQSFTWNKYAHGDVIMRQEAAESLALRGNTMLEHDFSKPYYYYSPREKGGRFYEQYPLLPLLAAFLIKITGNSDGYFASKVLSLVGGILVLFLTYLLGTKIGGPKLGLFSAALTSFSYLLIDFSGNGSLYSLQTAFYLAFIILLLNLKKWQDNIILGVVAGFAVILNYQSISLLPAYLIFIFFLLEKNLRETLRWFVAGILPVILIFAPWGVRNFLVFGDPFFDLNSAYMWNKLGVKQVITGDVITYDLTLKNYIDLFKKVAFFWLPHNLYFINRKLFIFAPVAYSLFLFSAIETVFVKSFKKTRNIWPLFMIFVFHTFLGAVIPIFETRHFVPLLPLVFILAGHYLFNFIKPLFFRNFVIGFTVAATIVFAILAYFSTPTRTYYYDGSITESPFGAEGGGELVWLEKMGITAGGVLVK